MWIWFVFKIQFDSSNFQKMTLNFNLNTYTATSIEINHSSQKKTTIKNKLSMLCVQK